MKPLINLTFVLILSTFCFGQNDTISSKKNETKELNQKSIIEVPKFSNADVQKFADEYSVYFYEILKASKEGNEEKVNELSEDAVKWAERSQEVTTKMTPEDIQKWAEWAEQLAARAAQE